MKEQKNGPNLYDGLIRAVLEYRLARDGYEEWRDRDINRARSTMSGKEIDRGVWAAAQAYNRAEDVLKAEILKAAQTAQGKCYVASHRSDLWQQISWLRSGPANGREALRRIEASMAMGYKCPIEIVPLWDGPVVITIRRPEGVEERPITEGEALALLTALDLLGLKPLEDASNSEDAGEQERKPEENKEGDRAA